MNRKQYEKIQKGVELWVDMMIKEKELKIYDSKIVNGERVFGWQGEDEIVASIMSYIDIAYTPLSKKCHICKKGKLIPDKKSVKKGTKEWCGHSFRYDCSCFPNLRISSG